MAEMVEVISPPFAAALRRNREQLNTRWFVARPRGEPADFLRVLATNVDGPVAAVAAIAPPTTVDQVCDALYGAALQFWSRGLLGSDPRTDGMAALFQHAFPAIAPVLAARPEETVGALTHAVLSLRREACVDLVAWVHDVAALGPLTEDLDLLQSIGIVMAWRHGLAHARDAALAALAALPNAPAPVVAAMGGRMGVIELTSDDLVARLSRRWRSSRDSDTGSPRLVIVGYAGHFEAFGGPFVRPHTVSVTDDGRIVARDDAGSWIVHADDFGAVLRPVSAVAPATPRGSAHVDADGTVAWRGLRASFSALSRAGTWAETSDTLAVACEDSHRVRLIAVHGKGA